MKRNPKKYANYHRDVKRAVNSMDDCFDFMQEPLYGFRTQIMTRKSCGNFGISCNIFNRRSGNTERQSGNDFSSEAPTDCRVERDEDCVL